MFFYPNEVLPRSSHLSNNGWTLWHCDASLIYKGKIYFSPYHCAVWVPFPNLSGGLLKWMVLSGQLAWQRVLLITNFLWHSQGAGHNSLHGICYWAHNSLHQIIHVIQYYKGDRLAIKDSLTRSSKRTRNHHQHCCVQQQKQETPIGTAVHFLTPPPPKLK